MPDQKRESPFPTRVEGFCKRLYRPEFPERFGSIEDSRAFGQMFFPRYNHEHHHSGIALLTPEMLQYGMSGMVIEQRQQVLDAAYARNPGTLHPRPAKAPAPAHRGLDQPATQPS